MIIPQKITDFNRSDAELQEFLIYGICVAGKRAKEVAPKVNAFVDSLCDVDGELLEPFTGIRELIRYDLLEEAMRDFKLGCYKDLAKALWEITFLDLRKCSVEDLEACHGIGPKTSRFFMLHSRADQRHVVLDTHLLKWARSEGFNAPKSTPTNISAYKKIEQSILDFLSKTIYDFAQFDLNKWKEYAK